METRTATDGARGRGAARLGGGMDQFEDLLAVQEHDSTVDRLRAQREKLPERQQLVEREQAVGELEAKLAELEAARDEAERDEKRLEDNVSALEARMGEVEQDLYSGATSSPRELQAMQAEIEQFKRQRSGLEDQELEVMERREGLEGEIGQIQEKLADIRVDVERLRQTIEETETALQRQLDEASEARSEVADRIPGTLLDLYEKIRVQNNGVGAARLVGGTCQGCHLALPAMEVDRIKREPADALVRCDQCGSILVR